MQSRDNRFHPTPVSAATVESRLQQAGASVADIEIALYDTGAHMALANGRGIDFAHLESIYTALDVSCWVRGMCATPRWRGQTPALWSDFQHTILVAYIGLQLLLRDWAELANPQPTVDLFALRALLIDGWELGDMVHAVVWAAMFHDSEESLIGDPPRGMGRAPHLRPVAGLPESGLKAFKLAVREQVIRRLAEDLGVRPAREGSPLMDYVRRADSVYDIEHERRAFARPAGCTDLNSAPSLRFELTPERAKTLDLVAGVKPWAASFACMYNHCMDLLSALVLIERAALPTPAYADRMLAALLAAATCYQDGADQSTLWEPAEKSGPLHGAVWHRPAVPESATCDVRTRPLHIERESHDCSVHGCTALQDCLDRAAMSGRPLR